MFKRVMPLFLMLFLCLSLCGCNNVATLPETQVPDLSLDSESGSSQSDIDPQEQSQEPEQEQSQEPEQEQSQEPEQEPEQEPPVLIADVLDPASCEPERGIKVFQDIASFFGRRIDK